MIQPIRFVKDLLPVRQVDDHRRALVYVPGTAPTVPIKSSLTQRWIVAMSANAAGSNIGIEVARTRNAPSRMGTAAGVVIMGAFLFGLTGMALFGVALDLAGGYSPRNFRLAWATQFVLFAAGFVGVWVARSRVRRLG